MNATLEDLKRQIVLISRMRHIAAMLYWDMATNMPKGGFPAHADAMTFANTEMIRLSATKELEDVLNKLSQPKEYEALDSKWQFIVKRMKRDLEKNRKVPPQLLAAYVEARSASRHIWQEAKQKADFSIFAPHLEKMIALSREMASCKEPDKEVYDVMLDQYEEGMTSNTLDLIFAELKEGLIPLVEKILAAPGPDYPRFEGIYDIEQQRKVQRLLLSYIGYSWEKGCVAETEHPFAVPVAPNDVRVNNHFYEKLPLRAIFSSIHEGGHAIFEQNINPDFGGTVAGQIENMGLHESQSRFFENILGRNKNFWIPIYGQVQELMPGFKDISLEEFYHEINHVRNSCIRLEADEVTYCLHIIIRYELEKMIFRDNVPVYELPSLWNQKMQEYMHITPANDAEGILQDMHWSEGNFGYFPTYLLGSIYDGMFLEALEKDKGPVDELLKNGKILEITRWLNENIHIYGSTRLPKEVIDAVCHKPVSAAPLLNYFTRKYTELYNL